MSKIDDNNINGFEPEESNAPQPVEEKKFGDVRDFARDMEEIVDIPDEDLEPDPDSAESYAAQKLKEAKKQKRQERENNRRQLVKIGAFLLFSVIVFIYMSIAWFTMNRNVSSGGMGVRSVASLFELKTSGDEGLYDNYIINADSDYSSGNETGGSNGQKIIWQLTSQSNMENLWDGEGTPTLEDMKRIQKLEADDYGLSPGDYGQLTFTIVPKTAAGFTAKIKPLVTCYKTTYDSDGYQSGTVTRMDEEIGEDEEAMRYLSGHILFYYMYDSNDDGIDEMHLINDSFSIENIMSNTDVTIYWVWPNRLNNILELNVEGLDSSANAELRKYFFTDPSIFLLKTSSDSTTVFNSITLGSNATDAQINAAVSSMTTSASVYSSWSGRYNSADQIIGDRVGYIMLEVQVEPNETNE